MVRIARINPGSIADTLELPPGLTLLSLNGNELRDSLDLLFYQAEEEVELETETSAGERVIYEIRKTPDEPLGIVPEPDKVRRCTNACPFCFVKGNPKLDKLRPGLYIKDDDYRLSFVHGHYVTLTNLRDDDWERIFAQRLSPLYVSVHATDPEVRRSMLKNPRSAAINDDLDRLAGGGVDIHAQVVLCPGVNDGPVLERTMEDLYGRGEAVRSLSIVPVGLTRYNEGRGGRELTRDECRRTLEQIDIVRGRARRERGFGWCYGADELFLRAGAEPPGRAYFDEGQLESNGVGSISWLTDEVRSGLDRLGNLSGRRIRLVTGTSMGPSLSDLAGEIERASGADVRTVIASNTLYGSAVTTAGLLSGEDHLTALTDAEPGVVALFSRQALNDHDLFLDDLSLEQLRAALPRIEIWPSTNILDVLAPA